MLFSRFLFTSFLLTALSFLTPSAFAQQFALSETAERFIGMWTRLI